MKKIGVIIIILATAYSCSDKAKGLDAPDLSPEVVNPSDFTLTITRDNVEADGVSSAELLVKATTSVSSKYKKVQFDVSPTGKFSNGTSTISLDLDLNGEARVFLSSETIGRSFVTAKAGHYTRNLAVNFIPALPDQVFIEPDGAIMSPDFASKIIVKARLVRQQGKVSANQSIEFYDSTSTIPSVGIFLNTTTSNAAGEITTEYRLQDTAFRGTVFLKGHFVANDKRGMSRIVVQK